MLPSMVFDYHSLAKMKVETYIFKPEFPDTGMCVLCIDDRSWAQHFLQRLFSC